MGTAEERQQVSDSPIPLVYDGFLSYSHAADDLLAPRLQAGLQRFAKPWWKRRAVRIFRDDASLSANPHLWSSITEALDQSEWFVLLLSPEAAESEWVNREVEYWLAHREASRILPVVTDGEFGWVETDFSPDTDSVPPALYAALGEEPRWVDLRWARSHTDLDLRNTQFRAAVADIASAIRGVAKDELASEEVKQHRRTIRTAWAAGIALFLLVLLAGGAALFAVGQRNEAVENERVAQVRELAAASLANLQVDPDRSLLLALEAARMTFDEDATVLREAAEALHGALLASRLEATLPDSGRGAFSPDGRLFVAGDPAAPATLAGRSVVVGSLRLRLVADDADGRATIWDVGSRERLGECCDHIPGTDAVPTGRSKGVSHVVLSGDGRLAATTGPDDRVKVWEMATGELLLDVGHFGAFSLALSPDGALVAATSTSGVVRVWEVTTGDQPVTLPRLPDPAGIAFSPQGTMLAVAVVLDSTARVYDVGTGNELTVLEHGSRVWDVMFDQSGERLLSSDDSTAVLWDLVTGEPLQTFRGHSATVGGVDFSPDGGRIATASADGTARVWDMESGDVLIELATGVTDYVTFSPDGSRLATAQADDTAKIWSVSAQGGGEVLAISERGPVASVAFDGRHRLATVGADSGDLHVYEVSSGSELLHLPGVSPALLPGVSTAGGIAFSTDGSLLGAPGPDNTAIVLDSETGDVLLTLEGHEGPVLGVGFSHDGQWVVTAGGDRAVRLWNAATGEERLADRRTGSTFVRPPYVVTLGEAFTVQFSPDDLLVLSASRDGVAQLSEVPIGRAARRFEHPAPLSAATFSPDGKLVATASGDGTASIWDVDTAERLLVLAVSAVQVSDVDFSPDGSRLATGSADGTVKLWDAATGEELLSLRPHTAGVTDLDFSHDGLYLATTGMDGTVQVLLLDIGQLVALAESRVTRSLTDSECQRYLHLQACPPGT